MSQVWINSQGHFLLGRLTVPAKPTDIGVVLVPGFLEPSSDLYYWNREFLEQLSENGISGLAIDLLGHGDSYLNFCDLNIGIMIQNIRDSVAFLNEQGIQRIALVGRGVSGNLVSKVAKEMDCILAAFSLNPLLLNQSHLSKLHGYVAAPGQYVTLTKEVLINLEAILYMAGVDMSNIEEERINRQFLDDLLNQEHLFRLDNWAEECDVMITDDVMRFYDNEMEPYKCNGFFYNYNDRLGLIERIIRGILEKSRM